MQVGRGASIILLTPQHVHLHTCRIRRDHKTHANEFEWACVMFDQPVNFRNWISWVRLDHTLHQAFYQNRNTKSFWPSVLVCPEVRFIIGSSSYSNKSLSNSKVEHLWDSSLSWVLSGTALCCHKKNWPEQLRGFIPGPVKPLLTGQDGIRCP